MFVALSSLAFFVIFVFHEELLQLQHVTGADQELHVGPYGMQELIFQIQGLVNLNTVLQVSNLLQL